MISDDQIYEWLKTLRERPSMILVHNSDYKHLQNYIEGYIDGIGHATGNNIRLNISEWFQKKIDQKASVYWTDHIFHYYKNKTLEELRLILIDTTEEYFRSNPDWRAI